MGDRDRRTPKSMGKAIDLGANKPPPELPEDLPEKVKHYMSWRNDQRNVLFDVINQGYLGTCWTITINNMISTHLFIHNKIGSLLMFSQKHVYVKNEEKLSTGYLKKFEGLCKYLQKIGLILSTECKCTMDKDGVTSTDQCNKIKGRDYYMIDEFVLVQKNINETDIISLLHTHGPIVVDIVMSRKYRGSKIDEIYYGPKGVARGEENHLVLLTGIGTKGGVHYFEYQNTYGKKWGGDNGFGKFARKISLPLGEKSLINGYMYPKLLERNFIQRR